jgi:hypothetical protein
MWDRDRAHECIKDYLGNVPRFNDAGFIRMFHVSRQKYDELRSILCNSDPFFRDSIDARNRRSISYGTAINALRDYFQIGESTSRLCVKHFA